MHSVLALLEEKKPVYALLAPTLEKTFSNQEEKDEFYDSLLRLGFVSWCEIAEEAASLAEQEVNAWKTSAKGLLFSSSCPAVVKIIQEEYQDLFEYLSGTKSPMFLASHKIKNIIPNAKTIFIGPCFWKKEEKKRLEFQEGNVDAVLTFSEFKKVLNERGMSLSWNPNAQNCAEQPAFGLENPGQIAVCVEQKMREMGVEHLPQFLSVAGRKQCREVLDAVREGKYKNCYIEFMACVDGCGFNNKKDDE